MRSSAFLARLALTATTVTGLAGLALAALPTPVTAADPTVQVEGFAFTPDTVTIPVGGSVTWTIGNDPEQHTVTPTDDAAFDDSGPLFPGDTFSVRFADPGTFAYLCTFHPFMTGTITVVAASPSATEALATAGSSDQVSAATPASSAPVTSPSPAPLTGANGDSAGDGDGPPAALLGAIAVVVIATIGALLFVRSIRSRRRGDDSER